MLILEHCFIIAPISFFCKIFILFLKLLRIWEDRLGSLDETESNNFIKAEYGLVGHFRILKTPDRREPESIYLLAFSYWSLPDTQKRLTTKQGDVERHKWARPANVQGLSSSSQRSSSTYSPLDPAWAQRGDWPPLGDMPQTHLYPRCFSEVKQM